jgi:hypothetical protein
MATDTLTVLAGLRALKHVGKSEHEVKLWCMRLVKTVGALDARLACARGERPLGEPDATNLLTEVENVLHDKAFALISHEFAFPSSDELDADGRVPASAFGGLRQQMTDKEAPATEALRQSPMPVRCTAADLLGIAWFRLHAAVEAAGTNPWVANARAATFASLCECLPDDLCVLCSGMGVLQVSQEKHVNACARPELEYYRCTLPSIAPTKRLFDLTLSEVAALVQVLNFCHFSLDMRGAAYDSLRALATRAAALVDEAPHDVVKRLYTALVGQCFAGRRVRQLGEDRRREIEIGEDAYRALHARMCEVVKSIRVGPMMRKEATNSILNVLVRRWDRVTFITNDTLGKLSPQFMAPKMWGPVYGELFGFMESREDMWNNPNLAPEIRIVLGLYLFYFAYVTYYGGADSFIKEYARLDDAVTDGSPAAVRFDKGPMRGAGDRPPPLFARVGNVFGVWYDGALHTSNNDFVAMLHCFLTIVERDMDAGIGAPGDIAPFLEECGIISPEEASRKRARVAFSADVLLGIL